MKSYKRLPQIVDYQNMSMKKHHTLKRLMHIIQTSNILLDICMHLTFLRISLIFAKFVDSNVLEDSSN